MKIDRQVIRIIETVAPAISSGQETIDSILEKYPQYSRELDPRLEAVLWLVNAKKDLEPRNGFISSSRQYVEDQFESVQPHGLWQRMSRQHTPQRWVFNIATPVMLVLLLVLVIHDLVLTTRLSIPGDPFYSTKLMIEDIQLALTFEQAEKTNQHIQLSRQRELEFLELVMKGDYAYLPSATSRLETEINASVQSLNNLSKNDPAVEMRMMANFKESLSNEIFMLNMLKRTAPNSASPEIELAIQVSLSGLYGLN
jgi:hypothetical protein